MWCHMGIAVYQLKLNRRNTTQRFEPNTLMHSPSQHLNVSQENREHCGDDLPQPITAKHRPRLRNFCTKLRTVHRMFSMCSKTDYDVNDALIWSLRCSVKTMRFWLKNLRLLKAFFLEIPSCENSVALQSFSKGIFLVRIATFCTERHVTETKLKCRHKHQFPFPIDIIINGKVRKPRSMIWEIMCTHDDTSALYVKKSHV